MSISRSAISPDVDIDITLVETNPSSRPGNAITHPIDFYCSLFLPFSLGGKAFKTIH